MHYHNDMKGENIDMIAQTTLRRRSFYTLFGTLVLVLVLPMNILILSLWGGISAMTQQDYVELSEQSIDNVAQTVDTYVSARLNLVYELANNRYVRDIAAHIDETEAQLRENCQVVASFLRPLQTYDAVFNVAAVFFPQRDLVVCARNARMDPQDFYESYVAMDGLTAQTFYDEVLRQQSSHYFSACTASPTASGSPSEIMLYVQPVSIGYLKDRAYFLSVIDAARFADLLHTGVGDNAHFQLTDMRDRLLLRSDGIPWKDGIPVNQSGWVTGGNHRYHLFFSSMHSGLQCRYMIPETAVLKRMNSFGLLWIGSQGALLLLGVVLARVMAQRIYRPFEGLLHQAFPGGHSPAAKNLREEAALVVDRMRLEREETRRVQAELQSRQRAMQQGALMRLLTQSSALTAEALREESEMCGLPGAQARYQVAVVEGALVADELEVSAEERFVLLRMRLSKNQCIVTAAYPQPVLPGENELAARLCVSGVRVGVSRVYDDIRQLQRCLREASCALHSTGESRGAPCVHYDELVGDAEMIYYPIEKEMLLLSGIRNAQTQEVCALLSSIREVNLSERRLLPDMVNCLYNSMIATAFKAHELVQPEDKGALDRSLHALSLLSERGGTKDVRGEALFSEILTCYEQLCEAAHRSGERRNRHVVEEILAYLQAEYANTTLCLDSVAEHFGVSYYFLSKVIKEELNQGFHDVLSGIRIAQATRLLLSTDRTVQDISSTCGFTNWSTFLRAFRKRTGTTPQQYRSLQSQQ